jgi:hypothetical protein
MVSWKLKDIEMLLPGGKFIVVDEANEKNFNNLEKRVHLATLERDQ